MRLKGTESHAPHRGYVFGAFVLDIDRAALLHNGKNVALRPKTLDVLTRLVEHHGRLVEKEELLDSVWPKTAVTDDSLTHCLIEIRKALGDAERTMIRTVPRRGFIFDLPVKSISTIERLERRQQRGKLVAAVAAGLILSIAAGHLLLFAGQQDAAPRPAVDVPEFDREAMDLHVRGHFLFHRRAPGDLESAEEVLKQAIELEPEFAAAWAELAGVYVLQYYGDGTVDTDVLPTLKEAAEKSVELDPDLGAGWVRLAHYYSAVGDLPSAERYMQRAADAESGDPLLLSVLAGEYARAGKLDRAIELQQRALAADPLSLVNRHNLSGYLLAAGRYDDALREAERAVQLSPEAYRTELNLAFALIKLEDYERALELAAGWPNGPEKDLATAMSALVLNRETVGMQAMERLKASTDIESIRYLAELEAFCVNIENAFMYLAQLRDLVGTQLDQRQWRWQLSLMKLSPFLGPVRDDPRWQILLDEAQSPMIADSTEAPFSTSTE